MCSYLRQSFSLPKKLFISRRNSSSRFFSVLSSVHGKPSTNYYRNNIFLTKTNKSKQIQYRHFSLDNLRYFFDSLLSSEPTKLVKNAIIEAHDITGLSWSFTIVAAAAVLKLFVGFPCGIYQQHILSKLELTKIELDGAVKKLREATTKKAIRGQWTNEKFMSEFKEEIRKLRTALIVKNNCHPFKITILFLIQFPLWLLLTFSIRSLALDAYSRNMENPLPALQFQVGGPSWCPNLSEPDPTLILPTINALCLLAVTELSLSSRIEAQYKSFLMKTIIPNLLRAFAVLFFFVSSVSPAGLSLFWMSSSSFTLVQNLLILSPRIRRIFKIPKTVFESNKPYSYAFNNFVGKLRNVFIHKK